MNAAVSGCPDAAMGALASLRDRVRAELGLVDDAGGAIDVVRALRLSVGTHAAAEAVEEQAIRVLADRARFQEFVSNLTVGETHFLRQPLQLEQIVALLGPALMAGERRQVWSAGCSSGEEAFSVALLTNESFGSAALSSLRVLGTDVSERAIAQGRAARFSRWSFRGCPSWLLGHFTQAADGFELSTEAIRRAVVLEAGELLARARRFEPRSVDVVLFRNVAIYLEEAHLHAFYEAAAVALKPGAPLVIGSADPRPGAAFRADETDPDRCIFVTRPVGARSAPAFTTPARARPPLGKPTSPRPPTSTSDARSTRPVSETPSLMSANGVVRVSAPKVPLLALATTTSEPPAPAEQMQRAARLADEGSLVAAREALLPLVASMKGAPTPWWAGALALLGRVELEAGLIDAAVERLRRAVFLTPDDPRPRYWYGLALQGAGRPEATLGQLREAARLLAEDGSSGDDELRSAVATALEAWR